MIEVAERKTDEERRDVEAKGQSSCMNPQRGLRNVEVVPTK